MTHEEAVDFLSELDFSKGEVWADIGAGTGVFTMAIAELLTEGKIFALDKSPHMLWRLSPPGNISLQIVDTDFLKPLPIDQCDGMVMANALHYTDQWVSTLRNVLEQLKEGGQFILIEYETSMSNPYVPFPIRFSQFEDICSEVGLSAPRQIATRPSQYGHAQIYGAAAVKTSTK